MLIQTHIVQLILDLNKNEIIPFCFYSFDLQWFTGGHCDLWLKLLSHF